jgi:hypothetical protein
MTFNHYFNDLGINNLQIKIFLAFQNHYYGLSLQFQVGFNRGI